MEINPSQIEQCDLWGQEPTLTLKEFNVFFPELLKLCPNMKKLFFSTNGVGFINEILNLVKVMSDTITNEYTLSMQFSYDGKENTKDKRGISPQIILNNIENFILQLNELELNPKLTVEMFFHSVTDDSIIIKYADENNMTELYEHLMEFDELSNRFISLNQNPNVRVVGFSPGLICPFNASVEEGKALVKYYNNCEKVGKNIVNKTWRGLTHQTYMPIINIDYDSVIRTLSKVANQNIIVDELRPISSNVGCNFSYHALKIRYDGTLMHCQSAIMGLTHEELEGRNGLSYDGQRQKISHNFYPNVVTDSDEVLSEYFYQVDLYTEQSYPLLFSQTVNLMLYLLNAKQIDDSYQDLSKLLKHAFIMSLHNGCPWNNMLETGSIIGRSAGRIRFFCNGFLDLCDILCEEEKQKNRLREERMGSCCYAIEDRR